MEAFNDFPISKQLKNAINDLGFEQPTPIQSEAFNLVKSGKDLVGISQTGTGKTLAYCLPILADLKYSEQVQPRVLIVVPTRELVTQVVEALESYTAYMTVRIKGVFGGVNIVTQRQELLAGFDIIVATPRRLFDLVMSKSIQLKSVKKFVIDEVDVMLDLGFRSQITSILDLLPEKRQSIMFSATMTDDVMELIHDSFVDPQKIQIALSGTPLDNIEQSCYQLPNFYSKANFLSHVLKDKETYSKVLMFHSNRRYVERLYEILDEELNGNVGMIHSSMSQNNRFRAIEEFNEGKHRVLIATDLMARGIDLDKITHVINVDVPNFAENYMHRIGRTGRAQEQGNAVLLFTEKEMEFKDSIETLMDYKIPQFDLPDGVQITSQLTPEERPRQKELNSQKVDEEEGGGAYHEKKAKNKKVNLGGSYKRKIKTKYKKAKTKGDKNYNKRKKR